MTVVRRFEILAGRAAGSAHPNALLALATAVVFAVTLGLCSTGESQCPKVGAGWCMISPSANPCSIYTSCQPTGPGYTCTAVGNPKAIEGTYRIDRLLSWQLCSSPATNSSMSCTYTTKNCGTFHYFVSGMRSCSVPCADIWYWDTCIAKASSDLC